MSTWKEELQNSAQFQGQIEFIATLAAYSLGILLAVCMAFLPVTHITLAAIALSSGIGIIAAITGIIAGSMRETNEHYLRKHGWL